MGKKSLIKSTAKKKTGTKKAGEEKAVKKPAAKASKKSTSKTATKKAAESTKKATAKRTKKTAAGKKAAPAKTSAKKKSTKTKPKATSKAVPKSAPKKKVSVKDLVFKKFEPLQPLPEPMASPAPAVSKHSAPPLIDTSDPKQAQNMRKLLFNKYDMDDIKASAPEPQVEKPSPPAAELDSQTEPETQASETAPRPQEENAYITIEPNEQNGDTTQMSRPAKIAIAFAALIVILILAISSNNASKYYIFAKDDGIEIWKGRFSPKDNKFFIALDGTQLPEPAKAIYSKKEVFPMILNHYIDKADALLEEPGLPNFHQIKGHLEKAEKFIVDTETRTAATSRLDNIERMILLYKADVAMSKNTQESLDAAVMLLEKAAKLTSSAAMSEEISQKIQKAKEQAAGLKAPPEKLEIEKKAKPGPDADDS